MEVMGEKGDLWWSGTGRRVGCGALLAPCPPILGVRAR
jgi:hypothetical protein